MRRLIVPVLALAVSCSVVIGAAAQQNDFPAPNASCVPFGGQAPAGQTVPTTIEPAQAIWCYTQPVAGQPTRLSGANDWVDTFDNNGLSIQQLQDGNYDYRRFDYTSQGRIVVGQFVNVNHWMPDIADNSPYRLSGGSQLSPNRSFHSENGRLVVEVDAAAGSDGMGGADAFYELDLSGSRPTGIDVDTLYGYGQFGGQGAVGCRLERQQDGGHIVCAMYDNSRRDAGGTDVIDRSHGVPGRVWEVQGAGTELTGGQVAGGYPGYHIPDTNLRVSDVWRQCADNELDLHCRDRFRFEFTQTSIDIYVNGYPVYYVHNLSTSNSRSQDARIPSAWLNNSFVYATSWINGGMHHPTRWHWDGFMVNRHNADGSFHSPDAYSSFCLGAVHNTCADLGQPSGVPTSTAVLTSTPVPTPTNTPLPASTPTITPTPQTHVCAVDAWLDGQLVRVVKPLSFCESSV